MGSLQPKDFQFEIIKEAIKKDPSNNIVLSPISLLFPLALLSKGANGQTLTEIQKVLNDSTNKNIYIDNLNQIYKEIKDEEEYLKISNAILTEVKISPHFAQNALSYDVKFDDLKNPKQINNWVKEKTNNKIKNMIDNLDLRTVMAVLNELYFHDDWAEAFDSERTSSQYFYLSNNTKKKVKMMYHHFENAKYFENDNYQAINLPYKNSQISATIVLPGKDTSINDFITNMSTELFFSLFKGMYTNEIELYLPRIKLESSYELNDILTNLGIKEAFQNSADFSSMTEAKPFFINKINQKTFLEIDEKGTRAASSTFGEIICMAGPIYEMRCDRPYLVFLTKYCPVIKKTLILFCAKIENP